MWLWSKRRGRRRGYGVVALPCIQALIGGCAIDSRELDVSNEPDQPSNASGAMPGQELSDDELAESSMTPLKVEPSGPTSGDQGSGAGGTLMASTALLAFGNQEVGIASSMLDWTITNPAERPSGELTLSNPNPEEFQIASDCPPVLAAHTSCTIRVSLIPAAFGRRTGMLELSDGSSRVTLQVTGNGLFRLTVVRAGLGLGKVTSSGLDIDCGNSCTALVGGTLTLNARTQNGDNSFFTGWSNSACDGQNRDCTLSVDHSQTVTATFAPMDYNLIFVSSKEYPPTLGGLAAYDAECNALASAAGINDLTGTAFVAGMSDGSPASTANGNIIERLGNARGWVRMDGLPVADISASLFGATANYPPSLTELTGRFGEYGTLVWTGFSSDADSGGATTNDHCGNWTRALPDSFVSTGETEALFWSGNLSLTPCTNNGVNIPIYCVGKSKQQPLGSQPRFTGKTMWVTNTPYVVGSITPDQKCQSERPMGIASGVAFIARSDRPASAVIDPEATYVLPDGRLIGKGAQLIALQMAAGPWLQANGSTTYYLQFAWTGGVNNVPVTVPADPSITCRDWTTSDPAASGFLGLPAYANGGIWAASAQPCNEEAYLYCVEP